MEDVNKSGKQIFGGKAARRKALDKLVISLGGSVLTKNNYANVYKITEILENISENYAVLVVTGGGELARDLMSVIEKNREFIESLPHTPKDIVNRMKDEIGIEVSRLHAKLLASLRGYSGYIVPTKVRDAIGALVHYKVVFMGGTFRGQSTDAVAASAAARFKAKMLINVSDVDGVYTKDPKIHKDAEKIKEMTYDEFWDIIKDYKQEPGHYELFDHKAFKIIKDHKIPLKFVSLDDLERFDDPDVGTLVH